MHSSDRHIIIQFKKEVVIPWLTTVLEPWIARLEQTKKPTAELAAPRLKDFYDGVKARFHKTAYHTLLDLYPYLKPLIDEADNFTRRAKKLTDDPSSLSQENLQLFLTDIGAARDRIQSEVERDEAEETRENKQVFVGKFMQDWFGVNQQSVVGGLQTFAGGARHKYKLFFPTVEEFCRSRNDSELWFTNNFNGLKNLDELKEFCPELPGAIVAGNDLITAINNIIEKELEVIEAINDPEERARRLLRLINEVRQLHFNSEKNIFEGTDNIFRSEQENPVDRR